MATDLTVVEYRTLPDLPCYRIGDDGSVWSRLERKYVKGRVGVQYVEGENWIRIKSGNSDGYRLHSLYDSERTKRTYLVLRAFVGPCPPGMECCHNDGNRANNHLSNLRWDTPKENQADSRRHGTRPLGEKHPNAKLTRDVVLRIRRRVASGERQCDVARDEGVSITQVSVIILRKSWAHLN
jgi:hypothetical protein